MIFNFLNHLYGLLIYFYPKYILSFTFNKRYCNSLKRFNLVLLLVKYIYIFFFLHAHPKTWQNNQRIDGGRILVEVEVEV
jgi:hypothetical protein